MTDGQRGRGVYAACPECAEEVEHHAWDLFECPECGRFWDTNGEVRTA